MAIASFVLLLLLVKLISMRIQHIHNRWGDQGAATASVIERILAMERLLAPVGKDSHNAEDAAAKCVSCQFLRRLGDGLVVYVKVCLPVSVSVST